jgi:hypothetical protein
MEEINEKKKNMKVCNVILFQFTKIFFFFYNKKMKIYDFY